MLGEKQLTFPLDPGACCDDNEPYVRPGWEWDIFRIGNTNANTTPGTDQQRGSSNNPRAFGSRHSGGFHAALGDGSVRIVNYNIDRTTYSRLCNRSDGQVVGDY